MPASTIRLDVGYSTFRSNGRGVAAAVAAVQSRCDGSLKSPVKNTGSPDAIAAAMSLR